MLDAPAHLSCVERGNELNRYSGIISQLSVRPDVEHERWTLEAELVPRLWLLGQQRQSEIFLERSVPEIVGEKLLSHGLVPEQDFTMLLRSHYPRREFVAQYEETDLAFVLRLCEHAGIVFFFEEEDDRERLVFVDHNDRYRDVRRASLPVRQRADHPAAWNVQTVLRRVPREAQVHDYNYRTPLLALKELLPIQRPAMNGGWTEFGPHAKTIGEARHLATVRSEEWQARHHVVRGATTEASVRAGGIIHLTDAAASEQRVLLTSVEYSFRARPDAPGASSVSGWENQFSSIPAAVAFRPPRETPLPRVPGLVNAVVDGAIRGEYAELDEQGRYHLRMAYDRSGRTDLGATHPVRMMQPHSGAYYGIHFPLRPGAEVLVGFVNADPDRPVIVGAAPNPITSTPVAQPNQTQNVLRTGSNNEIVIEDLKGTERFRIHTPHKETTLQLGAVEEPEEGVFMTTEAHVSAASRRSNNVMTDRHTTIARTTTALLGESAVIVAGLPGVTQATEKGFNDPASLSVQSVEADLARLASLSPETLAAPSGAEGGGGGLQSSIASASADRANESVLALTRAASEATDDALAKSKGRSSGEPMGTPAHPAAIIASERTAALVGRDAALIFADRAATLSSNDTASVVGREVALLKSPGTVEVAGTKTVGVTSAGELDIAANTARIVAGYYPEAEAPPLDGTVSLGVMSKHDLRIHSIEDCILICAKKNLIGSAHDGDVKLTAENTVALKGGSITGSAGTISLDSDETKIKASGDIDVEAGGTVTIKAATVEVHAGLIRLVGTVMVDGDFFVRGDSNL